MTGALEVFLRRVEPSARERRLMESLSSPWHPCYDDQPQPWFGQPRYYPWQVLTREWSASFRLFNPARRPDDRDAYTANMALAPGSVRIYEHAINGEPATLLGLPITVGASGDPTPRE